MGPLTDKNHALPPLQNGDHLTGAEFERRLAAMGDVRAELIDGVVYMGPPVGYEHGAPHNALGTWAGVYAAFTPGVNAASDTTLRLDAKGRPQPDVLLWIQPKAGGRVRYDADGILRGTVELVIEVAASSAAYDLHEKKLAYERQGLPEYVAFLVHTKELLWFVNEEGEFVANAPDAGGIARSRVFPGLWLDTRAFVRGDMARVLDVVRDGLATKEHDAFVAELRSRLPR